VGRGSGRTTASAAGVRTSLGGRRGPSPGCSWSQTSSACWASWRSTSGNPGCPGRLAGLPPAACPLCGASGAGCARGGARVGSDAAIRVRRTQDKCVLHSFSLDCCTMHSRAAYPCGQWRTSWAVAGTARVFAFLKRQNSSVPQQSFQHSTSPPTAPRRLPQSPIASTTRPRRRLQDSAAQPAGWAPCTACAPALLEVSRATTTTHLAAWRSAPRLPRRAHQAGASRRALATAPIPPHPCARHLAAHRPLPTWAHLAWPPCPARQLALWRPQRQGGGRQGGIKQRAAGAGACDALVQLSSSSGRSQHPGAVGKAARAPWSACSSDNAASSSGLVEQGLWRRWCSWSATARSRPKLTAGELGSWSKAPSTDQQPRHHHQQQQQGQQRWRARAPVSSRAWPAPPAAREAAGPAAPRAPPPPPPPRGRTLPGTDLAQPSCLQLRQLPVLPAAGQGTCATACVCASGSPRQSGSSGRRRSSSNSSASVRGGRHSSHC
jgi:hypothetical protein